MADYKRANNLLLTIELVPKTVWFSNVRSMVSAQDWDKLRKESYKDSNYKCEICGGIGKKHPVECHEIWEYNDKNFIQKLIGLIALCPSCHEVKHAGFACGRGGENQVIEHLQMINGWDFDEANEYINQQFLLWRKRSLFEWDVDLTWLDKKTIRYEVDREKKPKRPYPKYKNEQK